MQEWGIERVDGVNMKDALKGNMLGGYKQYKEQFTHQTSVAVGAAVSSQIAVVLDTRVPNDIMSCPCQLLNAEPQSM